MAAKENEVYERMEGHLMRCLQEYKAELAILQSGRVVELQALIANTETELAAHRERHKDKLPPEPAKETRDDARR